MQPFIMIDNTAFVKDPNFKKLVELYFGEGTKFTLLEEWNKSYEENPISKVLYIHVTEEKHPPNTVTHSPTARNTSRLTDFWELMREMQDYPVNLIIDTTYETQEEFITNYMNQKESETVKCV